MHRRRFTDDSLEWDQPRADLSRSALTTEAQQSVLHNVSCRGARIASNPSRYWPIPPAAFPPVWIKPGQMKGGLVSADTVGFSHAVRGHHTPLHVLGAAAKELHMLGVKFPPKRAGVRVEAEYPRPLLVRVLRLQQREQFFLFLIRQSR